MTYPPSFAIILTHNRPELLEQCVDAISPQVDQVLIIDNASSPPVGGGSYTGLPWPNNVYVINVPDQPPNLSALWNLGFQWAHDVDHCAPAWDVAVLCDDAVVPPDWFRTVADGMRAHNAAAASTGGIRPAAFPILKTAPDSDIMWRMCSWAFVVRGEARVPDGTPEGAPLRADERLLWWWGDTRLDFLARTAGGMVIVPGPVVINERPNDFLTSIPALGEQAGRDTETFMAIYHGWRPW